MSNELITNPHWLEPLFPESMPSSLLSLADRMRFEAGRLSGCLAPETAIRLGGLLRVTSSFYSNLIEGQFTEPLTLNANTTRRSSKQLNELAVSHLAVQERFERLLIRRPDIPWCELFSPRFIALLHRRLFSGANADDLRLQDGSLMKPGQLRDEARRNVLVGRHEAPYWSAVTPMLERMQKVYGSLQDPRQRLLAAMAYHHRLAWVHPFPDGNGRVVRLLTHLQLYKLGLVSPLWSLSRGLARQHDLYYARLANADQPRRGDLDGRGQLTQAGLFEFMQFMLETSLDQMHYMIETMDRAKMRERLDRLIKLDDKIIDAGIKPGASRALHILISQGTVSRSDFKVFLGLGERVAIEQLKKLTELGLVESPTPKARDLYPGMPVWFAQSLFPDLHRRFVS